MAHLKIEHGIVKSETTSSEDGRHTVVLNPPEHRFWLTLVDDDGGEFVLWDGCDYDRAIVEAEEAGRLEAWPVLDLVGAE